MILDKEIEGQDTLLFGRYISKQNFIKQLNDDTYE
jgi:hypothetical protein